MIYGSKFLYTLRFAARGFTFFEINYLEICFFFFFFLIVIFKQTLRPLHFVISYFDLHLKQTNSQSLQQRGHSFFLISTL